MDWFERLTGFPETRYEETRSKLDVEGGQLLSRVNGRRYAIGELELVSLHELRARAGAGGPAGRLSFRNVSGDVGRMHGYAEYRRALFQVASQFNLLEMTGPDVTPEDGVTRYQSDPTQGPACAIAAGAATLYRNYFAPVGDRIGQTAARQLDGLAGIGEALSRATGRPVEALWRMRNGYALCTDDGLAHVSDHLLASDDRAIDDLRGRLCIGLHRDVEVTTQAGDGAPTVSQAFCSALPVSYTPLAPARWRAFAALVLEAAYEATLWGAVLNARRGASKIVLLTRIGGGAFGNDNAWIDKALLRTLNLFRDFELDVRLVSRHAPPRAMLDLEDRFGGR